MAICKAFGCEFGVGLGFGLVGVLDLFGVWSADFGVGC